MCIPLAHHTDGSILLLRGAHHDEVFDDCADARRHRGVVFSGHIRLAARLPLPVPHHTADGVDVGRDGEDTLRGVGVRHHIPCVVHHEGSFGKAVLDCHQRNDAVTRRDR